MADNNKEINPDTGLSASEKETSKQGILGLFEKFNFRLSTWFSWLGMVAISMMLVMTVVDVVGTKAFHMPVPGYDDATGLEQLLAISFAGAITLILGQHINVDMLTRRLPKRVDAGVRSFVTLLGLGIFILIVWQLFVLARSFQISGELTEAFRLPFYPFAYTAAVAFIPLCLVLIWQLMCSIVKAVKA